MTSTPQKAKQSSRWGSLFSGAVAGLESRLDTILAEDGASAAQRKAEVLKVEQLRADRPTSNGGASNASSGPSTPRPESQVQTNRSSIDSLTNRSNGTPPPKSILPRTSLDAISPDPIATSKVEHEETTFSRSDTPAEDNAGPPMVGGASLTAPNTASDLAPSGGTIVAAGTPPASASEKQSVDLPTSLEASNLATALADPSKNNEELQAQLQQAQNDYERVELRRQEEAHENLERIDALQAKLRYLAREASAAARQAAKDAGDDAMQKRIADQDDKIAQLMEEGIKLSKSEVSQTGTIRNLRAKAAEDTNTVADLQRKLNRAERQLGDAVSDVARLERERAQASAKASRLAKTEREMASLREAHASKDQTIQRLQRELKDAADRADDNDKRLATEALEKERKSAQSLQEDLANMKIEQSIRDDRAKADVERVKQQLQRETDRHRTAELGLRNEISSLEGRLEVMRERTEEASSGTTGDAQAKLMRQIEILQSQYAVASDNWQGIESSLQARVTALEKERDESARHEAEARKRARESGSSARRLQDQLEDAMVKSRVFEQEIEEQKAHAEKVQKKAKQFERDLDEAKASFERERKDWNSTIQKKLEEERAKAQRQPPMTPTNLGPATSEGQLGFPSPQSTLARGTSASDLNGLSLRWHSSKMSDFGQSGVRSSYSRRSSALPPQPHRTLSEASPAHDDVGSPSLVASGGAAGTPIPRTPDFESADAFESTFSPSRNINDVVSTSTAGAGPSVQLVERMSASVRRLESEKAAAKDEMARLQTQRDEARKEIVALMSEVEAKREVDQQVEKQQKELGAVKAKFERMAEMFGEKSEQCEELEADVADLKKIYRELVERTVT